MKQIWLKRTDKRLIELEKKDAKLTRLFDDVGDLAIEISWEMFPFMVFTILGQQLSVKVAQTLFQRVRDACLGTLDAARVLNIPHERLREIGLSNRKAEYLHALSEASLKGHLDIKRFDLDQKEAIFKHFQMIRGIGPWSVDMMMMFVLDDMDHFSKKDLGLIHGYNRFFDFQLSPDEIEKDALNWRPYRSIVAHYLWHVHDR